MIELKTVVLRSEGVSEDGRLVDRALGYHRHPVHELVVLHLDAVPMNRRAPTGHVVLHVRYYQVSLAHLWEQREQRLRYPPQSRD